MTHNFYTVTFVTQAGIQQVSRFFNTVRAGRNYVKWLSGQPFVTEVSLYRGQAGGELIARRAV